MRGIAQRIFQSQTMIYHWPPAAPLPRIRWWMWGLIALFSVLVIAGVVRMLRPQMDERLYARYRNLPQAHFMTPADSACSNLSAACAAFNLKQYTKALPLFEADNCPGYTEEKRLFVALCHLELNRMKEAEAQLALILDQGAQHPLHTEALWYTALSHLRRHDRAGYETFLRAVPVGSARYESALKLGKKTE